MFNESLRYVAEEKDKLIDDLRSKESSLKTELINKDKTINNLIETTSVSILFKQNKSVYVIK